MLDGYSKINTLRFLKDANATYTTKFLASAFMNDSIKDEGIARGLFVGGIEPPPHWGPTAVLGPNDNNYIKMRRIGEQSMLLSDSMIASEIAADGVSFQANIRPNMLKYVPGADWYDDIDPLGDMCMLGTMAHAAEDLDTGIMTGAMGCVGIQDNYHIVFTIEPSAPNTRKILSKIHLPSGRRPSYMHALGYTPHYIVLVADPLYMNMVSVLKGDPLGEGGLETNSDPTLFHLVDRKTGAVRTLKAPGFIFGHILNTFEDGEDIVIDLTWYSANNATTLGWMNRWLLSYMMSEPIREAWPRGQVVRYRLKANDEVEEARLFADENGANDFEAPKINEEFQGLKYCISYFMQFHTYEYDKDPTSVQSGPFGAVGIAKRNLCTGERSGWYEPNTYPSEVQFVPNPSGSAEDDGILLSMVFDGNRNASYFQILDARTMMRIAKAPLPIKTPFLIHASWFPEQEGPLEIVV
jgi:carotenoid cleavage dioxygenase-like enzyme